MNGTIRKTDFGFQRQQMQRLAIAAGMTLKDGSTIVVGGPKCPPTAKIKEAIGFQKNRMTREQFENAKEDFGAARRYFLATHDGGEDVEVILSEWSGFTDCDGEMSLRDYLQAG